MKLQTRIAVATSAFFSAILITASLIIYIQFAEFRKVEFESRLEEKALSSVRLLVNVKEVDKQLLKLIDKNTIHTLYNEKTIIFDNRYKIIYNSADDVVISWKSEDLEELKESKTFLKKQGIYEVYGLYFRSNSEEYFVLVAAEDKYGFRKLLFLRYLLIATCLVGTALVWIFSIYGIRNMLKPLLMFQQKITNISDQNLNMRLEETNSLNEINLMTRAFNQMMNRIENAYMKQQEFTANASHELQTPLARIIMQIENLHEEEIHTEATKNYLDNIKADASEMADLIHSLLLLTKLNNIAQEAFSEIKRIDEVLFDAIQENKLRMPYATIDFSMDESDNYELEIPCNESLLKIAFGNLIKNAWLYSINAHCSIRFSQSKGKLSISFMSTGELLSSNERLLLFQPFMRGKNTHNKPGSGLGLRITQRILAYHNARIAYFSQAQDQNIFKVTISM